jgi:hypothetical protein
LLTHGHGIAGGSFNIALPRLVSRRLKAQIGNFALAHLAVDALLSLESQPFITLRNLGGELGSSRFGPLGFPTFALNPPLFLALLTFPTIRLPLQAADFTVFIR